MYEKKSLILMVEDEEQVLNTNCRMTAEIFFHRM